MKDFINVKIGSFDWKIKKVNEGSKYLIIDNEICYGVCQVDELTIYIQGNNLNRQLYKAYLIHELTHAFIFSMGYSYRFNKKMNEEDVCYFFECHGEEILKVANKILKELF